MNNTQLRMLADYIVLASKGQTVKSEDIMESFRTLEGFTDSVDGDKLPISVKRLDETTLRFTSFVDNGLHQGKTVEYWEEELRLSGEFLSDDGNTRFGPDRNRMDRAVIGRDSAIALRDNDPVAYAEMHNTGYNSWDKVNVLDGGQDDI